MYTSSSIRLKYYYIIIIYKYSIKFHNVRKTAWYIHVNVSKCVFKLPLKSFR